MIKTALSVLPSVTPERGTTWLIYHRVGGGSPDERDLAAEAFRRQVDLLAEHHVVPIDEAVERSEKGDDRPGVVLTFDDGFRDVYENAWPLLRERRLPFTVYLATAFVEGTMHWDGSTAKAAGPALTWAQLEEMLASGLCTVGAHTHNHARPEALSLEELEQCDAEIEKRLGVRPEHFTYPWGVPVPRMEAELRRRYRSASTGQLGRNGAGADLHRLRRVPVRGTDPLPFFKAKLGTGLLPERAYAGIVSVAKKAGVRA